MPIPPRRKSPRKRPWSQPLADLVGAAIDPVLARQGFSQSDLILHWDDIVGARLAAVSRPIKLAWPSRSPGRQLDAAPQAAHLVIRVEGAFAIEFQHMSDQVLARINAHLGWRCVGKLAFRQGAIAQEAPPRRGRASSPDAVATAAANLGFIENDDLRTALARLGAHIIP